MTHLNFYQNRHYRYFLLGIIMILFITVFFPGNLSAGKSGNDNDLDKDSVKIKNTVTIEQEITTAKKEVKKWETNLYKRKRWAVRSEKAEKQAERKLAKAKKLLKQKEKELADFKRDGD